MPSLRIHHRFLAPIVVTVLFAALVSWALGRALYASALERRLTHQLEHAARVLADGRFPFTPELLADVASLLRAEVLLLAPDARVMMSSLAPGDQVLEMARGALLAQGGIPAVPLHVSAARPYLLVTVPLHRGGDRRVVALALLSDLSDISEASRRSAGWLTLGALAGILLLVGVAHRIGRGITGPIGEMADMADRIAGGERGLRCAVSRSDELGALAGSLNAMSTRLEAYEQELVERNRLAALGMVTARVAHEIRNPLTAVKLQVELLAEQLDGDSGQVAADLVMEISRLELILSGVLELGRERPLRLERGVVDLGALIGEVARLFAPQLRHRGIRLETRLGPMPAMSLDANRIKQILVNLIVNARDAMTEGGEIRISTSMDPGSAVLAVEDSGPGWRTAPDDAAAAASGSAYGLGLGLSLSRELAEAHGGALITDSSDLGGARVRLVLPCDEAAE